MLRTHMLLAALLATGFTARAAEPKPEIQRQPAAPQAVGVAHTLRVIPEACALLEGRFTGDVSAPYRFSATRTGDRCQPRARLATGASP